MKKSVVLALAAALACGTASTVFAANPFSDVPADHWAYDAVAQLAEEGVIEGYGDGSFRGQQEITRYEMAQMVARALAKGNSPAAKAQLDKLTAEFADELNALGVRVANLEKKVDNVKFFGELRYTSRRMIEKHVDDAANNKTNLIQLRLYADAKVNKHWTARTGFFYDINNAQNSPNGAANASDAIRYLYARGVYGKTVIDLGAFESFEPITEGMLFDRRITGAKVTYGKDLKFTVLGGRANDRDYFGLEATRTTTAADVFGAYIQYKKKNLGLGAAYYGFSGLGHDTYNYVNGNQKDKANVWAISAQYKFGDDWRLYGTFAQNTKAKGMLEHAHNNIGYNIELDYKGAKKNVAGSYGAHIAYKHLGDGVVLGNSTYDYQCNNTKGFDLYGEVMLDKNIRLDLGYYWGKTLHADNSFKYPYTRVHFYF